MKEILTFIVSFLGVIGLIFLTYYASRWLNKRFSFSSSRKIRVIERASLAQDKSLVVVRVGKKSLLLGVTPQHIENICELDSEDMAEILSDEPAQGGTPSFLDNLKKATLEHSFVKPFVPAEKTEKDEKTDD